MNKWDKIVVKLGDITKEEVDCIVNPANGRLIHGGGVAASIVRNAGIDIQAESNKIVSKIGKIPTSKAVITDSYKLPCKFVIHVVGPKMGEGKEDEKLKKAVINVLKLADIYNLKTISIPAISSGIFGFPKEECAKILLETSYEFLNKENTSINKIIMCNFDDLTYNIFLKKKKEILNK